VNSSVSTQHTERLNRQARSSNGNHPEHLFNLRERFLYLRQQHFHHSLATRYPGRRALPTKPGSGSQRLCEWTARLRQGRFGRLPCRGRPALWARFSPLPVLPGHLWTIAGWTVGQRRDSCELGLDRCPHPREMRGPHHVGDRDPPTHPAPARLLNRFKANSIQPIRSKEKRSAGAGRRTLLSIPIGLGLGDDRDQLPSPGGA
jgi:hypothetical protein